MNKLVIFIALLASTPTFAATPVGTVTETKVSSNGIIYYRFTGGFSPSLPSCEWAWTSNHNINQVISTADIKNQIVNIDWQDNCEIIFASKNSDL